MPVLEGGEWAETGKFCYPSPYGKLQIQWETLFQGNKSSSDRAGCLQHSLASAALLRTCTDMSNLSKQIKWQIDKGLWKKLQNINAEKEFKQTKKHHENGRHITDFSIMVMVSKEMEKPCSHLHGQACKPSMHKTTKCHLRWASKCETRRQSVTELLWGKRSREEIGKRKCSNKASTKLPAQLNKKRWSTENWNLFSWWK